MKGIYTNPPLISVTASLSWHIESREMFNRLKLSQGILYDKIKDIFPVNLDTQLLNQTPFINTFKNNNSENLFIDIDLNSFTITSTDSDYCWGDFSKIIFEVADVYIEYLYKHFGEVKFYPSLKYLDFFVKPSNLDYLEFLNSYLNLKIENTLLPNLQDLDLMFKMKKGIGTLSVAYTNEEFENEDGIMVSFEANVIDEINNINSWFESAHNHCKVSFEELIHGKMLKIIK